MTDRPKTLAEQLDAAQTGRQFGNALLGFMAAMDRDRFDNLRTIQCAPTESDAELEADRDRKHAAAVQEWMENNADMYNGNDVAVAMAYNDGWFSMAKQVQQILAAHSGDRATILALSEQIARLAAGGARPGR